MNILVTAGPTREPIDPVRFIGNRSSGKMGYAVARAAARRGHGVRLISGPVCIAAPAKVRLTKVTTASEMLRAVRNSVEWCDALVMAAAVADWRPAKPARHKLKKTRRSASIKLVRTADVLATVGRMKGNRLFVGFAAETRNLLAEARRKLASKSLDLIVANDVSRRDAGFEVDTNKVTLIASEGHVEDVPHTTKDKVAVKIVRWIECRRKERAG